MTTLSTPISEFASPHPACGIPIPKKESCNTPAPKKEKKTADISYLGLWAKDSGENEPVAYFADEFAEKAKEFGILMFGEENFILATVKLDSRPLVTRSNLNGAKNLILTLLAKDS